MELINKKFFIKKGRLENPYVSVTDDGFYFTKAAVARYNLKPEHYIHFINDGKRWDMFQNNDPDGFQISTDGKGMGLKISSRPLIRMFSKSVGAKPGDRFYLLDTQRRQNNAPVIEILTNKKIEL